MVAGVRPGRSADQGLVVEQEATDDSPGGPPAHTGLEDCPVPVPSVSDARHFPALSSVSSACTLPVSVRT